MDINQTFELKNGNRLYNYFKCIQYLQQQGRILYGSSYLIHSSQRQQLYRLLVYATANKEECALYGIDLKKGLLVTGAGNSGKTSLLHLLKPFFQTNRQYIIRSSREVAFCYKRFGNYTLQQYLFHDLPYCFDDLGLEPLKLDTEVIKELLQYRLLHAADNTHISSRLNKGALIEKYGKDFTEFLYRKLNHIEFTNSFNL
ncbi:MAG: hypothetical protein RSF68_00385 [Myroides sp.]